MPDTIDVIHSLLLVSTIAIGVRVVASRLRTVSYTVLLMTAGLMTSVFEIRFAFELTHDLILFVLLPVILFFGAMELDTESYRKNLPAPLVLVVVGLPVAVLVIGVGTHLLTSLPLAASVLFAAMIYPVDPIAVIALFNEMQAPKRIIVLTEGESLLDDGFGIVVFSTVLTVFRRRTGGTPLTEIVSPEWLGGVAADVAVTSVGGLAIGFAIGYPGLRLVTTSLVDERMTELLCTVVLAFGAFLVAHHYVGVSGVLATVAVGLLAGASDRPFSLTQNSFHFIETVWDVGEFFVKTFLFLLIGSEVRIDHLVRHANLIAVGGLLVLVARAVVVYSLIPVVNRTLLSDPVSRRFRHVLVWGAMHTVIPIALVLSLAETLPYHEAFRTGVFGVAAVSVIVQGLLMPYVLRAIGVTSGVGDTGGDGEKPPEPRLTQESGTDEP